MSAFYKMGREALKNRKHTPDELKRLLAQPIKRVSGHWDDVTSHFNISDTGFGGRVPFTTPEEEHGYTNGIIKEAQDLCSRGRAPQAVVF